MPLSMPEARMASRISRADARPGEALSDSGASAPPAAH